MARIPSRSLGKSMLCMASARYSRFDWARYCDNATVASDSNGVTWLKLSDLKLGVLSIHFPNDSIWPVVVNSCGHEITCRSKA